MRRLSSVLAVAHAGLAAVVAVVLVAWAPSLAEGQEVAFVVGILVVAVVFAGGCLAAALAPHPGTRTASGVAAGGWALLLERAVVVDADGFVGLAAACALLSAAWVAVTLAAQVRAVRARVGLAVETP